MPHTPGPWQLGENGLSVFGPGEDGWGIATMILYERRASAQGISDEEQKANAHLMAAAPDLLEACETALKDVSQRIRALARSVDNCPPELRRLRKLQSLLAKAISQAKATGASP